MVTYDVIVTAGVGRLGLMGNDVGSKCVLDVFSPGTTFRSNYTYSASEIREVQWLPFAFNNLFKWEIIIVSESGV